MYVWFLGNTPQLHFPLDSERKNFQHKHVYKQKYVISPEKTQLNVPSLSAKGTSSQGDDQGHSLSTV